MSETNTTRTPARQAAKRPAAAKQPQDHLAKAEPETSTMRAEVRGVVYEVPTDALDDFELMGDIVEAQDGNPARMPALLRRLLGDVQYRAAMESLRDPATGRVSMEAGIELVGEIFEAIAPNS